MEMPSCIALCNSLKQLLTNLERDDLATSEALLIDLTGDWQAGMMLHRLILWLPKAKNPDGWVYKSWRDWWAELRIKQSDLPKLNGILEYVGVERVVKKANGNPTSHYRLDVGRFLERLAALLKMTVENILTLMGKNPFEGTPREAKNGFSERKGEPEKTITTTFQPTTLDGDDGIKETPLPEKSLEGQEPPQDAEAPPHPLTPSPLRREGEDMEMPEDVAEFFEPLADYLRPHIARDVEYARRVIEYARKARGLANRAAFAAARIVDRKLTFKPSPPTPSPSGRGETMGAEHKVMQAYQPGAAAAETLKSPYPAADEQQREQWRWAYDQLALQMDRNNFDTWLRDATLVGAAGDTFYVSARNGAARDMCQYRLYRNIAKVLSDVAGRTVEIKFEVPPAAPKPRGDMPLFRLLADDISEWVVR